MEDQAVPLIPQLGTEKKGVKQIVTAILGSEWPLTTKQLYRKVEAKRASISYQGVHKAISQLKQEGIVVKGENGFSLATDWIRAVKIHGESLEERYFGKSTPGGETLLLHPNLKVYVGRGKTMAALTETTRRVGPGDVLFGNCRTGIDYPKEFYDALENATANDTEFQCMVPDAIETDPFVKFLCGLGQHVKVRKSASECARIYGIKGKEVVLAFAFPDAYVSLHFTDKAATDYFYDQFHSKWASAPQFRHKV